MDVKGVQMTGILVIVFEKNFVHKVRYNIRSAACVTISQLVPLVVGSQADGELVVGHIHWLSRLHRESLVPNSSPGYAVSIQSFLAANSGRVSMV
jgi:hypothetical protein